MKTFLMLITTFLISPKQLLASGVVNGGHCYNGWHLSGGSCHPPHSGFLILVIVILVIIGVIYWMKKGD